jgi:hypothetical protein
MNLIILNVSLILFIIVGCLWAKLIDYCVEMEIKTKNDIIWKCIGFSPIFLILNILFILTKGA